MPCFQSLPARSVQAWTSRTSPITPAPIHSLVRREPSLACPWLPIEVITPAALAALVSSRHSCSVCVIGFLDIDVLARANRGHRGNGVGMVRSANGNRIDVLGLLVEHFAEVFVALRVRMRVERSRAPLIVNIAERDVIPAELRDRGNVAASHPSAADTCHVDLLAGREESGPAQHMPRNNREGERGGTAAARKWRRDVFCLRACQCWRAS